MFSVINSFCIGSTAIVRVALDDFVLEIGKKATAFYHVSAWCVEKD